MHHKLLLIRDVYTCTGVYGQRLEEWCSTTLLQVPILLDVASPITPRPAQLKLASPPLLTPARLWPSGAACLSVNRMWLQPQLCFNVDIAPFSIVSLTIACLNGWHKCHSQGSFWRLHNACTFTSVCLTVGKVVVGVSSSTLDRKSALPPRNQLAQAHECLLLGTQPKEFCFSAEVSQLDSPFLISSLTYNSKLYNTILLYWEICATLIFVIQKNLCRLVQFVCVSFYKHGHIKQKVCVCVCDAKFFCAG